MKTDDSLKEKNISFQEIEELKNFDLNKSSNNLMEEDKLSKIVPTNIDDWLDEVLFD